MHKILYFISICFVVASCYSCSKTPEQDEATAFFENARGKGNYFLSLDLLKPDSVVKHIHDDVPPKWYGLACESVYYHLKEGTSSDILLKHLDAYESWFPHDTVFTFTYTLRGKIFLRQNQYDTAMACLNKAYKVSTKIHSAHRIADVASAKGELYSRQGMYPEAIKSLLEAYNLYAGLPKPENQTVVFEAMIDLGNAYRGANDYESALTWHHRAWSYAYAREWAKGFKISSAAAVAADFCELNRLDSAKMMIDTAFYFQNLYAVTYDQAYRYYVLAKVLLKQGNCQEALVNFLTAQRLNLKTSDNIAVNRYNEGLGDGYLCVGRLDSAVAFYQKALATPDTARQVVILSQLAKTYERQGQLALALKSEQESHHLSNRVFTIEKNKAIGELQAQNEIERLERQFDEQISQDKIMRLGLLVVLLIFVVLFLIGLNRSRRQKQAWQLAQQEKALLTKEKELVEAREALKTKALVVAAQKLDSKERALEESNKQLNLKDLMIQELKMTITAHNQKEIEEITEEHFQNLKILTADDWRTFRKLFEQRYPDYLDTLVEHFPKVSAAEIRLLVLIKIGFDANEMANILGIFPSSVYKSRYRLRKKLGLVEEDDLERFVNAF